jgi:hypothetical protein
MLSEWLDSTTVPLRMAAALGVSFLFAAGYFYAARLSDKARSVALLVTSTAILAAPLLIPRELPSLRLIGALWSITLWVKVFDLHFAPRCGPTRLVIWVTHLPNPVAIVWRKLPLEPGYSLAIELLRFAVGGGLFLLGLVTMQFLWRSYWPDKPFAIEHVAKVSALFLTITAGAYALAAALRLAGGRAREAMDWPFLAATPADFWRRYNRPAQQFLYEDLFKPFGGRQHARRATLLTFFISGLIHEYVFAIPTVKLQAYQMTFFMLHGLAVARTVTLRPKGAARAFATIATLCFTLASTVLFFASFDEIMPFYSAGFPDWLRDWTILAW